MKRLLVLLLVVVFFCPSALALPGHGRARRPFSTEPELSGFKDGEAH